MVAICAPQRGAMSIFVGNGDSLDCEQPRSQAHQEVLLPPALSLCPAGRSC